METSSRDRGQGSQGINTTLQGPVNQTLASSIAGLEETTAGLARLETQNTGAGECEHPETAIDANLADSAIGKTPYKWEEFYNRAKAFRNKSPRPEDRVDFSKESLANAQNDFQNIEIQEWYNFPEDGDPKLYAACEALSNALQNAIKANVEHDPPEVKQALDNLQKAYDESAERNTVLMRYIDIEPAYSPYSPLNRYPPLKQFVLARPWLKELINIVHTQSFMHRIVVIGNPGIGESLGLFWLQCFLGLPS
jgi:hypothetical protein